MHDENLDSFASHFANCFSKQTRPQKCQIDSAIYVSTLQKYQLKIIPMGHQDNPSEHKHFILDKLNGMHLLCSYASYISF